MGGGVLFRFVMLSYGSTCLAMTAQSKNVFLETITTHTMVTHQQHVFRHCVGFKSNVFIVCLYSSFVCIHCGR